MMNNDIQSMARRGQRYAGRLAGIGAAATVALAWNGTKEMILAFHFTLIACLAPAVGCLVFTLIHRATGGQWARGLRPFLRAGSALLPWIWVCSLPLLLIWRSAEVSPLAGDSVWAYEGIRLLALRGLVIGGVFFWLSWAISLERGNDRDATQNRHPWVGPVGLIVTVFTLTILADDWIESGQAGWHSTAFPVVWIASQCVAGLALCVLCALLTGSNPSEKGVAGRPLGNDWGNLLLATVFFWSYVSFGEFLIIWSGNKPDEIAWYLSKEQGGWKYLAPALVAGNFLVPFFCLLSRNFKEKASSLIGLSVALAVGQVLYAAWLVLPEGYPLSADGSLISLACLLAGAGLFLHQFCRLVRRAEGGQR